MCRITAIAPVNNSLADLDVDLVNEQNQEVESVNIPIEYYRGATATAAWTEGGQTQDATLSSLPAGKYTLRVEGTWQNLQQPLPVAVKVEQNVTRGVNFCCAFIVLVIVPVLGSVPEIDVRIETLERQYVQRKWFGSSNRFVRCRCQFELMNNIA